MKELWISVILLYLAFVLVVSENVTKVTTTTATRRSYKLAVGWGQNRGGQEGSLHYYCYWRGSTFDIYTINMVTVFFDDRNKYHLPGLELASHCNGHKRFGNESSSYLKCTDIGKSIQYCQRNGKKILLTLGGTARWTGFANADQAKVFAQRVWQLFMGGSSKYPRTFGYGVQIDGVNIFWPHGDTSHFITFIKALRALMKTGKRNYLISTSFSCGSRITNSMKQAADLSDFIFVNVEHCLKDWSTTEGLKVKMETWLELESDIYIEVPSHFQYNSAKFYMEPSETEQFIKRYVLPNKKVAGMLVSDASYDDKNVNNEGERFSDVIAKLIRPERYNASTDASRHRSNAYKLAVGWGQNRGGQEGSLHYYCDWRGNTFDIYTINMLAVFFDDRNKDHLPGFDLNSHCKGHKGFGNEYPWYLKCTDIGKSIQYCQRNGKKILLTIGGTARWTGFANADQAKVFAQRVWQLFMGGSSKYPRTFGYGVQIDGVNIFWPNGDTSHFITFINALRALMKTGKRNYLITTSFSCDRRMTNSMKQAANSSDFIFVNVEHCLKDWSTTKGLKEKMVTWLELESDIYIEVPSHFQYNSAKFYIKPSETEQFIKRYVLPNKKVAGILVSDASYDDKNVNNEGQRFSDVIAKLIRPERYNASTDVSRQRSTAYKLAVGWGQNRGRKEGSLHYYCYWRRSTFDIYTINMLTVFFDDRNKDHLPGLELASHCNGHKGFGNEYPWYLKCTDIGKSIQYCQRIGKKILLTLGGTARWTGFANATQAKVFAQRVWQLFMGGSSKYPRTFGYGVQIDGVNIFWPNGDTSHFITFINALRALMKTGKRNYLITTSFLCDRRMTNSMKQAADLSDFIFVNVEHCLKDWSTTEGLKEKMETWLGLESDIYIEVPSHFQYNSAKFYIEPSETEQFIKRYVLPNKKVAGILVSDASYDDKNVNNEGERFSDVILKLILPERYKTSTDSSRRRSNGSRPQLNCSWQIFILIIYLYSL